MGNPAASHVNREKVIQQVYQFGYFRALDSRTRVQSAAQLRRDVTPTALTKNIASSRLLNSARAGAAREDEIRRERPNLYKSFLLTRLLVGIVGVLLPTFIVVWDLMGESISQRPWRLRGSLSAYYYHPSPLRDWFVGSLWAIGVGLMVYMGTRKSSWANAISWAAGVAALVVSLFPTNDDGMPPTWVSTLHFGAAAVLIIGLGLLCVGFGIYDNTREDNDAGKARRRWIHYLAAGAIFFSVSFAAANSWLDFWPSDGLLFAEMLAVYAFATSWFTKGWELFEYNRKRPSNEVGATAPDPGAA
jgi:hypothetical protein